MLPQSFHINVEYRQPTDHQLRKMWFSHVSLSYDYSEFCVVPFRPIPCCESVPLSNGQLDVELLKAEAESTVEEALAWIDQKGYRPALYEELLSFASRYKTLGLGCKVHAIGSVQATPGESYLSSAMIGRGESFDEDGNNLELGRYGYHTPNAKRFNVSDRFLVVAKV